MSSQRGRRVRSLLSCNAHSLSKLKKTAMCFVQFLWHDVHSSMTDDHMGVSMKWILELSILTSVLNSKYCLDFQAVEILTDDEK